MKKNVLALSITAALVGLGFAGGAQAITAINPGTGTSLAVNPNGFGHILFVPYFSAQGANNTLLNIVNTDTANGKAVKVRFRGASNSDDLYDFQVFLSPGDVWTANVSKGADGRATLFTADASCTKPAQSVLNSTGFITARLDPTLTGDALANQTREGYVEIFNMADIPKVLAGMPDAIDKTGAATANTVNDLYDVIKHQKSVPLCSGTAWTNIDTEFADIGKANAVGMTNPSNGLMANWIILNVADAGAWSGAATAVEAWVSPGGPGATGNLVYWPQTSDAPKSALTLNTADPLLVGGLDSLGATVPATITGADYDLPDMSTPYIAGNIGAPLTQARDITRAIATTKVLNEFLTNSAINSTTDWTLSMPTRRYSVAFDYSDVAADGRVFSVLPTDYFTTANTTVVNRQICVTKISTKSFDQEENSPTTPSSVVISPSVPGTELAFCGEANVLSINNGGSTVASGTLKATVARGDLENGYKAGWLFLGTPGLSGNGLPVVGSSFYRATAGSSTFGATLPHRTQVQSLNL